MGLCDRVVWGISGGGIDEREESPEEESSWIDEKEDLL